MMGRDVMREPVAMEIPAEEGPMASAARAPPRRIRMRLMEGARGGGAPASVEDIEAKLREAELRRQVGVPVGFLFPPIFFTFEEFCLRCFSSLAWWVAWLWRQLKASRAGVSELACPADFGFLSGLTGDIGVVVGWGLGTRPTFLSEWYFFYIILR
jgi:hypothetical protein